MDSETGMYYYGARYYDPRMSIFVSVDPLAEEFPNYGGYVYTMNNPINLVDPTGMAPEENDGWIIKKSRRDGNTIVMYDSDVNTMEDAKKKGYRDVEGVVETGYFQGEDELWRLEEDAMIYGEYSGKKIDVGVFAGGYRASDGTFFQENNGLKSLASGLQNGGNAMMYGGTAITIFGGGVLGAPMTKIGGVMGTTGTALEIVIEASEGKLTLEKFLTKAAVTVLGARMGKIGKNKSEKQINESVINLLDYTIDDARNNKKGVYKDKE